MYVFLFLWPVFVFWPLSTISLLEWIFNGFVTSHFLSDFGNFMTAGYFLAFSIPVLLKYALLILHARLISSQIILVGIPGGTGLMKSYRNFTLRIVHEGPDP
jgi:hypothetical protein